jgi:hypothetical protein
MDKSSSLPCPIFLPVTRPERLRKKNVRGLPRTFHFNKGRLLFYNANFLFQVFTSQANHINSALQILHVNFIVSIHSGNFN